MPSSESEANQDSFFETSLTSIQKRCIHFANAGESTSRHDSHDSEDARPNDSGPTDQPSTAKTGTTSNGDGAARPGSASSQQHTPTQSAGGRKFISDLNPTVTFLHRPREDARGRLLPNDDIGIWIDKLEYDDLIRRRDTATAEARNPSRPARRDPAAATINYGLPGDQRPHSGVLGPLVDIYFEKIHPILPLMNEAEFRDQQAEGTVREPLVHAICLVAAKDADAAVHLKLQASPSTLPPREFCNRLLASVMGALRAPCQYDKVTLIRILALASMHSEGADGAEESSMLLSQAMHHAQTLAIHLGQQSNNPSDADLSMKRLFWSLWILDRLNSIMNGRPIFMHEVDIAIEKFEPGESGYPVFDAWLKITELADKIITYYRPDYPLDVTGWEDQYPGLEEILDEVHGWHLSPSLHMTTHLYYLTIAALSHRSRGVKQIPRGTNSAIRQRLCSSEVARLMDSDYDGCKVHALPIVPYSVSIALSVAYQHLRQSQFDHQQKDACREFRKCAKILQSLRRTWSSADTMAALAKKVQDEMDKAPSLASFRITREAQRRAAEGEKEKEKNVPCMPAITGERMGLTDGLPSEQAAVQGAVDEQTALLTAPPTEQTLVEGSFGLFDGMDDVFGTYLDPNYPVNLDDLSFLDDMQDDMHTLGYNDAVIY
ncbi:hypothetical protein LTS14_005915 [Recurvomyces mirabilis]|uniref:uncharacterized protein n=1 Tax=Recurvomyces mirabilis TaxID=574656 RepID=UPI002DE1D24E|nr:hypothetical protein LTS14_005915 [Recurvomyces mirabilis]